MVTDSEIASIPGWFARTDVEAFRVLLDATARLFPDGGDLAELGVFKGKSAALIGAYVRPGERFTVIDLFESMAADQANAVENAQQYEGLTRATFETNYLHVHRELPTVVTGFSQSITDHAPLGTHRFVHIDASHLYKHVVSDLEAAKSLLTSNGVVVLDDYRSEHTPGVAAAAWRCDGLRPFLLTSTKMYATWGDPTPWKQAVSSWLASDWADHHEVQEIDSEDVYRVWTDEHRLKQLVPPVVAPALGRLRTRLGR